MRQIFFAIPFCLGSLLFFTTSPWAGSQHIHKTYKQRLIKSRAERGYDNHGRALYNFKEIDEYSDDLKGEEIGDLKVGSGVREVYNVVIVHNGIDSEKEELEVGKVKMKSAAKNVHNEVIVEDGITAESEEMEIGTVKVKSSDGVIHNEVVIDGNIIAEGGKEMEIGTVRINGQAERVDNNVRVEGGIHAK